MVTKVTPKTKFKTKPVIKAKKITTKPVTKSTIKTKPKMPTKTLKKKTAKATIVKRVTFTAQEFKEIQQMLTTNDCQTLKEWITKRISEQKLQQ